jgi:hypothetical protein
MPAGPATVAEAARVVDLARARGVHLRILGGVAVLLLCPSARDGPLRREVAPDIDLAGLARENRGIRESLEAAGYAGNRQFNAVHGYHRMMFYGPGGEPKVDVFLDRFRMCHSLDLRGRLEVAPLTLSPSDLLFTKLQVVELNEKDRLDIVRLLLDHPLTDADGATGINAAYLASLAADDWGVHTTLDDTLALVRDGLPALALEPGAMERVRGRIDELRGRLARAPKSLRWRLRAKVGRRVAWYELPDEPTTIRLGE